MRDNSVHRMVPLPKSVAMLTSVSIALRASAVAMPHRHQQDRYAQVAMFARRRLRPAQAQKQTKATSLKTAIQQRESAYGVHTRAPQVRVSARLALWAITAIRPP